MTPGDAVYSKNMSWKSGHITKDHKGKHRKLSGKAQLPSVFVQMDDVDGPMWWPEQDLLLGYREPK